jgi:hypothetical protein
MCVEFEGLSIRGRNARSCETAWLALMAAEPVGARHARILIAKLMGVTAQPCSISLAVRDEAVADASRSPSGDSGAASRPVQVGAAESRNGRLWLSMSLLRSIGHWGPPTGDTGGPIETVCSSPISCMPIGHCRWLSRSQGGGLLPLTARSPKRITRTVPADPRVRHHVVALSR